MARQSHIGPTMQLPLSVERFAQGSKKINTYLTIAANSLTLG